MLAGNLHTFGRMQAAICPSIRRTRVHVVRATTQQTGPDAASPQQQQQAVAVKLRKPVGVMFAQNQDGPVFVEDITAGSHAEKCGVINVGDVLTKCSAVVLKAGKEGQYEKEGYGQRPYDNWETILFNCEGQTFKTVMSALKSNNERWGINTVELYFRKPTEAEVDLCQKALSQ